MKKDPVVCVVGLGYVGLPLAVAFGKAGIKTLGFDVNPARIDALKKGEDWTHEVESEALKLGKVAFTDDASIIGEADIVIVAVPTPVDAENNPDLSMVRSASEIVGKNMKSGTIVVYESTVYPGVTEEVCVPILEEQSGLINKKDFTVGYSPERINPGDKEHTVDTIVKVVSGQDEKTLAALEALYGKIVTAGVFKAKNIKTAELAKALENTQRDINIALINEVARLCDKLKIRTKDVLDAAGTKWNFLKFYPGLVGGHCIGVDPYYLVAKAKQLGLDSEVISAGRKVNDTQPLFIAGQILRTAAAANISKGSSVLILGLTFKENVPDTRNAKVHDVIAALKQEGFSVAGHDPWLTAEQITALGIESDLQLEREYDIVILAVPHREYLAMDPKDFLKILKKPGVFYDLKSAIDPLVFKSAHTYISL